MATSAFSNKPLLAPTLMATDVDSVRVFMKKSKEYVELWSERQEDGKIDKDKKKKG